MQPHAAALDDQRARHTVARRGLEESGELGAVDLAHRATDELADLGRDIQLLAANLGFADHDAVVEGDRDAELGKVGAGQALGRRQQLDERAGVDDGRDSLTRRLLMEQGSAGHFSPLTSRPSSGDRRPGVAGA